MKSLIDYYSEVLGISSVIGDQKSLKGGILFVSVLRSSRPSLNEENAASALFEKMLKAIGGQRDKISFLEVSEVSRANLIDWTDKFKAIVILDAPNHALEFDQPQVLWSYHPQELLLNVSLKKQAWEQLKGLSLGGSNVH